MLQVSELTIDLGHRVLVRRASFHVAPGEKVALVGPNGTGKTTLLRTVAGELEPSGGSVVLPETHGWLRQDVQATPAAAYAAALDHLLSARHTSALAQEVEAARQGVEAAASHSGGNGLGGGAALERAVHRYAALEERFGAQGGYEAEAESRRIAAGVGLGPEVLDRPVGALSGGQRRRLELARLLYAGGELLILDEPTNHLDLDAKAWVMQFLRTSPASVLVVSHDLALLDDAIDRVLSLEHGQLDVYRGTYTRFLEQRTAREAQRAREHRQRAEEIARLSRSADRFRGGNQTMARKAKVLDRRAERLQAEGPTGPLRRRPFPKVRWPDPPRAGDVVLVADELSKSFGTTSVFRQVSFTVGRGETFLVLGLNGAGKTTLLRILAGLLEPDQGQVRLGARVRTGFYAQEHEDIRAGASVVDHMRERADLPDKDLRAVLGHFGLTGDTALQDASTLSGGEKTKLALARLIVSRSNLLLLDEPTNNLDTPSREAVLGALQRYAGTVVLVSHDTDFVAGLEPDRVVVLPEGDLLSFDEGALDLVALA